MNNQDQFKILDAFSTSYWSGQEVQIYANNVWIDEAIQCNYMIMEQVRPYYGYASYVADRILHGNRIINGELTINFKVDGYLFSLLKVLTNQDPTSLAVQKKPGTGQSGNYNLPVPPTNNPSGANLDISKLSNPNTAAAFVKAKKQQNSPSVVYNQDPDISDAKGIFETKLQGFDLNIIFGGKISSAQLLRLQNDGSYYADGAVTQITDTNNMGPGTGLKIIGVEIQGISKSIGDDGRSINETYSFIAKDVQVLKNINTNRQQSVTQAQQSVSTTDGIINQPPSNNGQIQSPIKNSVPG